jgi:hypothetical protein
VSLQAWDGWVQGWVQEMPMVLGLLQPSNLSNLFKKYRKGRKVSIFFISTPYKRI